MVDVAIVQEWLKFIESLLCIRHCLTCVLTPLVNHNPMRPCFYYSYFMDEEVRIEKLINCPEFA